MHHHLDSEQTAKKYIYIGTRCIIECRCCFVASLSLFLSLPSVKPNVLYYMCMSIRLKTDQYGHIDMCRRSVYEHKRRPFAQMAEGPGKCTVQFRLPSFRWLHIICNSHFQAKKKEGILTQNGIQNAFICLRLGNFYSFGLCNSIGIL